MKPNRGRRVDCRLSPTPPATRVRIERFLAVLMKASSTLGLFRLFFWFIAVPCLWGSAIGVSDQSTVCNVDYRQTPEPKDLAEYVRRIGNDVYPKILALLVDGTSRSPRQFDVVFVRRLKGKLAQTLNGTISLGGDWFSKYPTTLDATLVHEMSHVAQNYKSHAFEYWGEGIADYVCSKLGYTNEWNCPQCSGDYPHYQSGYRCAAAFLMYVDATYGANVVRRLNTELRRGSYRDSFFAKATGKDLGKLWAEFQTTPAFTTSAAERLRMEEALGYIHGEAPPNIAARVKSYLEQQHGGTLTLEAAGFVATLIREDQLPGIVRGHQGEVSVGVGALELRNEAGSAAYPAARTFYCKKTDDESTYHYRLVRASKDTAWRLQKAWQTDPSGRVLEEYSVP